jgi:F0F1-type ATP synthase assembly protein I
VSRNVLADAARESLRILAWQMGWVVACALAGAALFDSKVALAVLVGGAIGSIWTIYMAMTLFKHSLTHGVRMSAASFVVAWVVKLALTVSLLVIAFRSKVFEPFGLLGGLFGSMLAYWGWMVFRVKHADRADDSK